MAINWQQVQPYQSQGATYTAMVQQNAQNVRDDLMQVVNEPIKTVQAEMALKQQEMGLRGDLMNQIGQLRQQDVQSDANIREWLKMDNQSTPNYAGFEQYARMLHNEYGVSPNQLAQDNYEMFGLDAKEGYEIVNSINETIGKESNDRWEAAKQQIEADHSESLTEMQTHLDTLMDDPASNKDRISRVRADIASVEAEKQSKLNEANKLHEATMKQLTEGGVLYSSTAIRDLSKTRGEQRQQQKTKNQYSGANRGDFAPKFNTPDLDKNSRFPYTTESNGVYFTRNVSWDGTVGSVNPVNTDITNLLDEYSVDTGIDTAEILPLIGSESGYDNEAVSPTGVKGIAQVTEDTFDEIKADNLELFQKHGLEDADRTDLGASLLAGSLYYRDMKDLVGSDDPRLAYLAYNLGPSGSQLLRAALLEPALQNSTLEELGLYDPEVNRHHQTIKDNEGLYNKDFTVSDMRQRLANAVGMNIGDETADMLIHAVGERARAVKEARSGTDVNEAVIAELKEISNEKVGELADGTPMTAGQVNNKLEEAQPWLTANNDGTFGSTVDASRKLNLLENFVDKYDDFAPADPRESITTITADDIVAAHPDLTGKKDGKIVTEMLQLVQESPDFAMLGKKRALAALSGITIKNGLFEVNGVRTASVQQAIDRYRASEAGSELLQATMSSYIGEMETDVQEMRGHLDTFRELSKDLASGVYDNESDYSRSEAERSLYAAYDSFNMLSERIGGAYGAALAYEESVDNLRERTREERAKAESDRDAAKDMIRKHRSASRGAELIRDAESLGQLEKTYASKQFMDGNKVIPSTDQIELFKNASEVAKRGGLLSPGMAIGEFVRAWASGAKGKENLYNEELNQFKQAAIQLSGVNPDRFAVREGMSKRDRQIAEKLTLQAMQEYAEAVLNESGPTYDKLVAQLEEAIKRGEKLDEGLVSVLLGN